MNNLTLLETILIIYIIVVNVLGVIMIIMPKKVSNKIVIIWFGIAIPITLPVILYELTFDKLKRRKRKQDLEKEFNDFIKGGIENEKINL